jgi:hypothetical protein
MDQVNDLHEQVKELTKQLLATQQRLAQVDLRTDKTSRITLHQTISDSIAPHLQSEPMDESQRKAVVNRHLKLDDLPKPIRDANGLGTRALGNTADKKWITNHLPGLQADALDVVRIAAATWHLGLTSDLSPEARRQLYEDSIKDILVVAMDNAQKMARTQLKQAFEAAGAKGAYALLDFSPDSQDLEPGDTNLFQPAHVHALQELRKYNATIDSAKKSDKPKFSKRGGGGRPTFDRNQYRNFGGRGNHGGRGNFGRGGSRGQFSNNNRQSGNDQRPDDRNAPS